MISFLIIGFLLTTSLQYSEAQIGVSYGTQGDNLPPPEEVVTFLTQNNIAKIRLYEPNQAILNALKGKNIEVLLGIPNAIIIPMSTNPTISESWIKTNVQSYLPDVKITHVVAGNEISPINGNNGYSFFLVDAMKNLDSAITKANLRGQIKLTTSFDMSIVANAYPPSNASFTSERQAIFLDPVLGILANNNAPLLVNIYPYFPYVTNLKDVKVEQALFTSQTNVVNDGNLGYQNLFDIMLDSFYYALDKLGHGSMEIIVAETGWPSAGGVSASVENAKTYYTNLVQHVKKGTPKRPGKAIETYVFALFDENQRDGPAIEKYWGVFKANKEGKFPLQFN